MNNILDKLKDMLNSDEPSYLEIIDQFGEKALPLLEKLSKDEDTILALKAVSLASMMNDPRSLNILKDAAESDDRTMRINAAAGIRNYFGTTKLLAGDVSTKPVLDILEKLNNDSDPMVRLQAKKTLKFIDDQ